MYLSELIMEMKNIKTIVYSKTNGIVKLKLYGDLSWFVSMGKGSKNSLSLQVGWAKQKNNTTSVLQ